MPTRLIHLTDCHLFADPTAEIRGVRTRETLERTLAVVDRYLSSAERLIITGDLTHDEQLATYELLRDRLADWLPKLRVIPGNHDDRALMRAVFGDRIIPLNERNVFVDAAGGWRLIGLDSHVPGQLHGELGPAQLDWLRQQLAGGSAGPTMLFLHHPPFDLQSAWLDRIRLQDAAEFRAVLQHFPQVRVVCCGHIHQERTVILDGVTCFATPSTGVQFRPETEALEVDAIQPGFRLLDLHEDGTVETRIERVAPPAAGL